MSGRGGPSQVRRRQRRAEARVANPPARTTPRLQVRDALIASGEIETPILTNYDLTRGEPSELFFYTRALEAGFTELRHDHWPSEERILKGGSNLAFNGGDRNHVYILPDGTIAHVEIGYDMVHVSVAGATADVVENACFALRDLYPASYMTQEEDTRVPITFWSDGPFGPIPRLRKIEAATWDAIEGNYTADVKEALAGLMAWDGGPAADGQLLLWQGPPGTGKTWGLRALASEWAPWAEFHYITDPDAFFVQNPSYMIDVLLSDSYMAIDAPTGDVYQETDPEGKWRVLILEDTGELLSANAKEQYGQGLSRLLNVVDGMIGQGLRVLALVTTNDELGDLHPAVARPGRCASQIEFGPLSPEEASVWLGEATDEGGTVAELYARSQGGEVILDGEDVVGFTIPDGHNLEGFADTEDGVNAPAEEAMSGACANCGDDAADHAGEMNDGACGVEGCDCQSFDEAPSVMAALAEGGSYDYDPAHSVLTFTSVGGTTISYPVSGNGEIDVDQIQVFAGATAPDIPAQHQEGERLPDSNPAAEVDEPEVEDDKREEQAEEDELSGVSGMRWTAMIAPLGRPTDDGRIFAPDAISWRELPLSLGVMMDTPHADVVTGSPVCGRIDKIYQVGDTLMAEGVFDDSELGRDVARMVSDGTLRGVSVDLAISKMEIAYRGDILDENGAWKGGDAPAENEGPDMLDILFGGDQDDVMFVIWEGTIGAVTICPFPAFADARIEVAKSLVAASSPMLWTSTMQHGMTVVASGAEAVEVILASAVAEVEEEIPGGIPTRPPRSCFDDPAFEELTALTVDGFHVFGHAAAWGVCHIGIPGVCTTAPYSQSGYAYFHLKEVECDDGTVISCGTITLDTGHADRRMSRADTAAHYDNTGTAVADIVCGEDDFGIWFTGALRADVDDDTIRKLRGAVLSGDWRAANVNGDLELVALLAVNVPGFPVPRTRAMVAAADGEPHVLSLVAAGIYAGDEAEAAERAEYAKIEAMADVVDGTFDDLVASVEDPS